MTTTITITALEAEPGWNVDPFTFNGHDLCLATRICGEKVLEVTIYGDFTTVRSYSDYNPGGDSEPTERYPCKDMAQLRELVERLKGGQ